MKIRDFLSTVLPSRGVYFASRWDEKFRNYASTNIEDLALQLKAISADGAEAYVALAGFEKDRYYNAKGKYRTRTQENAAWVRSTWIDMDVGEQKAADGLGYLSQRDALGALKEFLTTTGLPAPTLIVNSGNGIHAYWVFTQDVPAALWARVARMFKGVLHELGVHADPSRTADAASVLRPPETLNHKDKTHPKPVTVLREGKPIGFKAWATQVRDLATQLHVPAARPRTEQRSKNAALGGEVVHKPSDAHKLAEQCPTIAEMRDTEGANQVSGMEPLWWACLGVLAFTEQGDEICHEWSQGHEGYDYDFTQQKIDWRRSQAGPTTCAYMRSLTGNLCKNCTQKCHSPIVLGHPDAQHAEKEFAIAPTGEQVETEIPPMPEGMEDYVFDPARGGLLQWTKDKDGKKFQRLLCSAFPTIEFLYQDTADGEHYAHLCTRTRPGVWEECDIKASALAQGGSALANALGGRAGIVARNQKGVEQFMQTWFDQHRKDQDLQIMRRQMGWQPDDAFVLGRYAYTANGERKACTLSKELLDYSRSHEPGGDRNEQIRLLDLIYNRPYFECYQFVLAASLGSALLSLIHRDYVGVPIALWEPGGGLGKTTACRTAIALWGDPLGNAQVANADRVTEFGMYLMAGMRRHLPVLVDETTDWDPKAVAKFAYNYSSGVAKIMGQADGKLRDNSGKNWQNFLFITSNTSLVGKIDATIPNCGARLARVFEIEIKLRGDDLKKVPLDDVHELSHHYGHIGQEFITYVAPRRAKVQKFVRAIYAQLQREVDDSPDARFWLMTAACAIAANRIATTLGLFRWQREPLEHFVRETLRTLRGVSNDQIEDPSEMLATMFNDLRTGFLVTNIWGGYKHVAMIDPHFPPPRNQEFTGRFLSQDRELFVPIGVVKRWCADHNVPYKRLLEMMTEGGWLIDRNAKRSLTVGTKLGSVGQTRCWRLKFKPDDVELEPDEEVIE